MKLYRTIDDIPIYIFDKVSNTGDLTYLIYHKTWYHRIIHILFPYKELPKIWESINNEFIKIFGISDKLQNYFMVMKEAIRLYEEAYSNDKKHLITFAKVKELEAKNFIDNEKTSLCTVAVHLSKFLHFHLDIKKITVREFYEYLKLAENNGKNQA